MPQYGMIVYSPAPADPNDLSAEHLAALAAYPEQAKALKGKVLGGTYFPKQRGFAFNSTGEAMTVSGDEVRSGTLAGPDLVASAFFVVAAPNVDVAVQIAQLHPAAPRGAVEVRPLFVPTGQVQDDYAD